jgi:hypothetical protein
MGDKPSETESELRQGAVALPPQNDAGRSTPLAYPPGMLKARQLGRTDLFDHRR